MLDIVSEHHHGETGEEDHREHRFALEFESESGNQDDCHGEEVRPETENSLDHNRKSHGLVHH